MVDVFTFLVVIELGCDTVICNLLQEVHENVQRGAGRVVAQHEQHPIVLSERAVVRRQQLEHFVADREQVAADLLDEVRRKVGGPQEFVHLVIAEESVDHFVVLGSQSHNGRCRVDWNDDGPNRDYRTNVVSHEFWVFRGQAEHYCRAHGVANIGDFEELVCSLLPHILSDRPKVKSRVVTQIKVEELSAHDVRVDVDMAAGVLIASQIAKPDIVAGLYCHKHGCLVDIVEHPRV